MLSDRCVFIQVTILKVVEGTLEELIFLLVWTFILWFIPYKYYIRCQGPRRNLFVLAKAVCY